MSLKIYVDGVLNNTSSPNNLILDYETIHPSGLTIRPHFLIGHPGATEDDFFLQGFMDEVRLSSISRTDDWIKISYESQRIGQELITIK